MRLKDKHSKHHRSCSGASANSGTNLNCLRVEICLINKVIMPFISEESVWIIGEVHALPKTPQIALEYNICCSVPVGLLVSERPEDHKKSKL